MAKITLALQPRTILGKRVKTLRKQGITPGNIFGNKINSTAVQVRGTDFRTIYDQAGETQIVYVKIDGEKEERPVLLTNTQREPISGSIVHVDFRQVNLAEKVTANIPIEIVGESSAVKDLSASLITSIDEVEVEALPADLPEKIIVDISGLKDIGDLIKVSDLNIDRTKVEVLDDPETVIVRVAQQQKEEEIVVAPVETEVIGAVAEPKIETDKDKKEEAPAKAS